MNDALPEQESAGTDTTSVLKPELEARVSAYVQRTVEEIGKRLVSGYTHHTDAPGDHEEDGNGTTITFSLGEMELPVLVEDVEGVPRKVVLERIICEMSNKSEEISRLAVLHKEMQEGGDLFRLCEKLVNDYRSLAQVQPVFGAVNSFALRILVSGADPAESMQKICVELVQGMLTGRMPKELSGFAEQFKQDQGAAMASLTSCLQSLGKVMTEVHSNSTFALMTNQEQNVFLLRAHEAAMASLNPSLTHLT